MTNSVEYNNDPRVYAPYLTWAYTKTDRMGLFQAAGMKMVYYVNPLQPICDAFNGTTCTTGDTYGYNDLETGGPYHAVAATDCSGNLITGSYGSNHYPALFENVYSQSASAYMQAMLDSAIGYVRYANPGYSKAYDLLFVDNAMSSLYSPSATPCGSSPASWDSAIGSDLAATTDGPYAVNSLGVQTVPQIQNELGTESAPVQAAMYELCYGGTGWNSAQPGVYVADQYAHPVWLTTEYAEIQTIARGKTFWCYQRMTGDATVVIPQRIYTYASFLLTYDAKLAIYQTALNPGPSLFKVFPETQIVPTLPLETGTDISQYLRIEGGYYRQWAQCYFQGKAVGGCAVYVNPTSATVSVPLGYAHSLVLTGGGVLDGGSAQIDGPTVNTLGPASAAILFE